MKSLITAALLAALTAPGLASDGSGMPAQPAQGFVRNCLAGGAAPAICACVLDRVMAVADDAIALDPALADGPSGVAGSSDPRLAEAFVAGARACGGAIALRDMTAR
jgi:hypothetical protein